MAEVPQLGELDELAAMATSRRQALIAWSLGIALVIGVCGAWLGGYVSPKSFGVLLFGGIFAAAAVGTLIKTPASKLPSVVVLRDRPDEVAYAVSMNRGGKHLLALAAQNHELLAKPLVLKGSMATPRRIDYALADDAASANRALQIVAARCPNVRATKISDHIGLASPAKLAKKAIAELRA